MFIADSVLNTTVPHYSQSPYTQNTLWIDSNLGTRRMSKNAQNKINFTTKTILLG